MNTRFLKLNDVSKRHISYNTKIILEAIVGIPFILYTYKCIAMVVFQSKMIYLPYIPLGSRDKMSWKERKKVIEDKYKSIIIDPISIKSNLSLIPENLSLHLETKNKVKLYKDVILKGYKCNFINKNSEELIIVYYQGNGGNQYHRAKFFESLLNDLSANHIYTQIYAINYRGYGDSTGKPSYYGLQIDAYNIYAYIKNRHLSSKIIIYGHSLGGAVAIHVSALLSQIDCKNFCGLIIDNTFLSIEQMVHSMYPAWLPYRYLAKYFLWNRWENMTKIKQIKTPMLFLSCKNDEVIPSYMMKELFNFSNNSSSTYKSFPYGGHFNAYKQPGYSNVISSFIKSLKVLKL